MARTESFGSPPIPLAAPLQPQKQWGSAYCPAPMSKPQPHPNPSQTLGPTGMLPAMAPKKKCPGLKAFVSSHLPLAAFSWHP